MTANETNAKNAGYHAQELPIETKSNQTNHRPKKVANPPPTRAPQRRAQMARILDPFFSMRATRFSAALNSADCRLVTQ